MKTGFGIKPTAKPIEMLRSLFKKLLGAKSSKSVNKLLFGLIILVAVVFFLMYTFLPNVKVRIFIETKPVSVEKQFTGEPNSVFNANLGTISVKTEDVPKERSDSGTATGKGARGDKAGGVVTVKCNNSAGANVTINAGTLITSKNGHTFALVANVNLACPDQASSTVQATAVGADYNLSSGDFFTVAGKNATDVWAENNAAFSGGSKTEYTAVTKADVDAVINRLKQIAFDEAAKDLKESKAINGWTIIESTIAHKIDGEAKSDVPVGSETDIFNVTLKTKSTATYYKKDEIDQTAEDLLTAKAKEEKLFEGTTELDKTSLQNVTKNITVEKVEGTKVTVKLAAQALVKPAVNKEEIIKNLTGKSWEDGKAYLATLKFGDKAMEVEYEPKSFPKFLWYFPIESRILVNVIENQAESTTESTPAQ